MIAYHLGVARYYWDSGVFKQCYIRSWEYRGVLRDHPAIYQVKLNFPIERKSSLNLLINKRFFDLSFLWTLRYIVLFI